MNIIVNPEQVARAVELLDTIKDVGIVATALLSIQCVFLLVIMVRK